MGSGKKVSLGIREVLFIANTRLALGVGIGLLLADKYNRRHRRKMGWKLVALGAATTAPIIVALAKR